MNKLSFRTLLAGLIAILCNLPATAEVMDFSPDYSSEDLPTVDNAQMEKIFPTTSGADYSSAAELDRLNKALRQYPHNAMLLAHKALVCAKLDRYIEANRDISKAIKLHPERQPYYLDRAQIYQAVGKYNEALADCKR